LLPNLAGIDDDEPLRIEILLCDANDVIRRHGLNIPERSPLHLWIAMTELHQLLAQIAGTRDCKVAASRGQPVLRESHRLPDDLAEFYRLAGGVSLFEHSTYPVRVVGPGEVVQANPVIVGTDCPDDISDSWYIVARGGREETITIDCGPDRLGRSYDSFWDRHGVAGDCRVIALSFTELLQRLFDNGGGYWYWLSGGAPGYGDAYDR
jgi:hypothetical protein